MTAVFDIMAAADPVAPREPGNLPDIHGANGVTASERHASFSVRVGMVHAAPPSDKWQFLGSIPRGRETGCAIANNADGPRVVLI